MKLRVGLLALSLIISAAFLTCKKEDRISPANPIINTIVMPGDWKITLFNESSTDKSGKFKLYTFRFNTNGSISAIINGSTINGAWTYAKDKDQEKIIIYFAGTPLNDLNDDWRIISQTSTNLELQHAPGENDGINYLTFSKVN
jgi:hypothetical protein